MIIEVFKKRIQFQYDYLINFYPSLKGIQLDDGQVLNILQKLVFLEVEKEQIDAAILRFFNIYKLADTDAEED